MATMQYWDDVIDAVTLTGYARAEAELADADSLARYLPNYYHDDIAVEFAMGRNGLVFDAPYRAYDAEPEIVGGEQEESVMIRLPAISQKTPISEYQQLRLRSGSNNTEPLARAIQRRMRQVVRAVGNTSDRQRAYVLVNGVAAANQRNFRFSDDFGRDPLLSQTVANLWTDPSVDRLDDLKKFRDVYEDISEQTPGALVMDRDAWNAFTMGDQFKVDFSSGMTRPASEADIRAFSIASGLPPIEVNTRRTSKGPVLPSGTVLFLPAPVSPNDPDGTDLGATFWGTSLSSMEPAYQIPDSDRPGIVAIAERSSSVPHIAQVTADAISLPVLANANLSGCLTVL